MHLAIRADGGPEIGYGHLVRSGALAAKIVDRGHRVTFATTTPRHVKDVCPTQVNTFKLPKRDDPEPFVEWIDTVSPNMVFTDAYPVDTFYQRIVRSRVPLAVLQDDDIHDICSDLFINGNLYAESLEYNFIGQPPKWCLGPDYVLLRDVIRNLSTRGQIYRDPPRKAIITMGGSDVANLTPKVLQAFDGLSVRVDTIIGPGFSEEQEHEIRTTAESISTPVVVTRDPRDLPERMLQADIAVSTASTTTYELLALGTPIVSIPVVENQVPIAAALSGRDIASVVQPADCTNGVRRAIKQYLDHPKLCRRRCRRGRQLVDARGTERVIQQLLSLAEENRAV